MHLISTSKLSGFDLHPPDLVTTLLNLRDVCFQTSPAWWLQSSLLLAWFWIKQTKLLEPFLQGSSPRHQSILTILSWTLLLFSTLLKRGDSKTGQNVPVTITLTLYRKTTPPFCYSLKLLCLGIQGIVHEGVHCRTTVGAGVHKLSEPLSPVIAPQDAAPPTGGSRIWNRGELCLHT